MIRAKTHRPAGSTKALVLGLLLAALIAAGLTLAANPAHAAETFTVDSSLDRADLNVGDGVCDGLFGQGNHCTLRAAIEEANVSPGKDLINFNIGGDTGVKTIAMIEGLPEITEAVTIDGYSQPGAEPNSLLFGNDAVLKIELNGFGAGPVDGLLITADGVEVRGLVINRFFFDGIDIKAGRTGKKIEGNYIGTDASGTLDRGNGGSGVLLDSSGNLLGGNDADAPNLIAFNGRDGVQVTEGGNPGSRILRNSIFSNDDLGIDLGNDGPTPNDDQDLDSGPNGLQNTPEITSATISGGQTTIAGELNSAPRKLYVVEFFSNDPGNDEGKKFLGNEVVTTDANGAADFSDVTNVAAPAGQSVTATATDSTNGDTSEFSAAVEVEQATVPPPNSAPSITNLSPAPGSRTRDASPTIRAKVSDRETDLFKSGIKLSLDGKAVTRFSYNSSTGKLFFTSKKLKKGKHTVQIKATDAQGRSTTRGFSFTVAAR